MIAVVSKLDHYDDVLAALDLERPAKDEAAPHPVLGHVRGKACA
jgi:hypothetical protein